MKKEGQKRGTKKRDNRETEREREREVSEKVIVIILPQGAEKKNHVTCESCEHNMMRHANQFETGLLACTDTEFKRMIK